MSWLDRLTARSCGSQPVYAAHFESIQEMAAYKPPSFFCDVSPGTAAVQSGQSLWLIYIMRNLGQNMKLSFALSLLPRLGSISLLAILGVAAAQDQPVARTALRVCQDPNNMPFSNTAAEGIENRIADVMGKAMGLPVTYYSFPQRLAFIRNTLKFKLPGEDYPCDIVIGVPVGFDQVSVTKPYYRSTYALVFAQGHGMDGVKSTEDFLKLPSATLKALRIGIYDRSPASDWLVKHELVDQGVPYRTMNADPAQYPGEIIEKDLAQGKIDAAVVWGPMAGYFVNKVKSPALQLVPLQSEEGVKFDYQIAMGVRYGERAWKDEVERIVEAKKPEIDAILREFDVPVVDALVETSKR